MLKRLREDGSGKIYLNFVHRYQSGVDLESLFDFLNPLNFFLPTTNYQRTYHSYSNTNLQSRTGSNILKNNAVARVRLYLYKNGSYMKKAIKAVLLPFCLLFGLQATAQIKGLFEKEEPVFNASVIPTEEQGTVKLVFYFTHGKASSIETSVWLRDEGTGMSGMGSNILVRGLKETYNRQQDTVTITGLNNQHFYTFGIDYRSPGFMSSKFDAVVLKSNYRYELPQSNPVAKTEEPRKEMAATPCQNPDLYVQIKSAGYCGAADRPAVEIQCMNCDGNNWTFDVQLRTATTGWVSLRADGQAQTAVGNGIRIEPLCAIEPGTYYVRILSQGINCPTPVIHNVSSFVTIADPSQRVTMQERSGNSSINPNLENNIATLPDTCIVRAQATLQGKVLRGTVELVNGSPCRDFYPFTKVHYVNPGYRNLESKPIALLAGVAVPFEMVLDDRDLSRNIHTLQIITYTRQEPEHEGIPMSAFWIKAGNALATPGNPTTQPQPYEQPKPNNPTTQTATISETSSEESSYTESIEAVSIKASDPNCTPIQDLNVVFFNTQEGKGDRPLYITWMNPRCCQEDGCKYTIWAGENPDRLRILVEGSKRGVFIRELLQDLLSTDKYIEVSVKTPNGNRKAAYVMNEGALYGIEALADYRDRLKPVANDRLVVQTGTDIPEISTIKGGSTVATNPNPTTSTNPPMVGGDLRERTPIAYDKPQKQITNYSPCKYAREILVVGERPAKLGTPLKIQYDFSDENYRYTLYLQPEGTTDWVLAPGTKESQETPVFNFNITPFHAGKYAILVHKATATWGCLAAPLEQAIEIKVIK